MSWTAARNYFKAKLIAQDFYEHEDAFDSQNIPETILDKSFHISFGPISSNGLNQRALDNRFQITIRTFFQGYADGSTAIDRAIQDNETLTALFLLPTDRLTGSIKNIEFSSLAFEPLSASQDNAVVAVSTFEVRSWLNIDC